MKKIKACFALALVLFFQQTLGHDKATQRYSDSGFRYPSSLSTDQLNIITNEMAEISSNQILYITQNRDHLFEVVACTKGKNVEGECELGEAFLFGQGRVTFANFSITPRSIKFINTKEETGTPTKPIEYTSGKYENVPFLYPSNLSKKQVERIIRKLSDYTQNDILSITPSDNSESNYSIMTCFAGARIQHYCDAGESYEFDAGNNKLTRSGNWVQ